MKKAVAIGIFGVFSAGLLSLLVAFVMQLVHAFQTNARVAGFAVVFALVLLLAVAGVVALLVWAEKQLTGGSK